MARTSKKVQEINGILKPDDLASWVVDKYQSWRGDQYTWLEQTKELRNYIFQTSTQDTSNKSLPWKNSTSVPKLTQLRDNLHANYYAALFPNDRWFKWEGDTKDSESRENAKLIESYMRHKIRESNFKQAVSKALYDYIDYGNAFGEVSYQTEIHTTEDGPNVAAYVGPRLFRISPYDIYFDISSDNFKDAGKVTRRVVSMGSLRRAEQENPEEFGWVSEALDDTMMTRHSLKAYGDSDIDKSEGFQVDGFGTLWSYYSSDMVELLEYEGDLYDVEKNELLSGYKIIVVDRRKVVYKEPFKSWFGKSNKEHCGWRDRPDNLYGMGPLDNLVGMQYRLDHLENLKADVFDQIAHPVVYQRGYVEEWDWGPGERIFGDVDSEVRVLSPDTTALNADFQMDMLMRNMEQLAGAPSEAMGIRTPGEKTAFEVQELQNAAGRIFQHKVAKFEQEFVEPLLNQMLESARRNLNGVEVIKVIDDDFAVAQFERITPDVLNQRGKLYPMGARHFAKQAQVVQNIFGFLNSAAYQDPAVTAHISGKKIAELLQENLGLEQFELVQENIRVAEQQQTQALAAQAQDTNAVEAADRAFPTEGPEFEDENVV